MVGADLKIRKSLIRVPSFDRTHLDDRLTRQRFDVVHALNEALLAASPRDIIRRNVKLIGGKLCIGSIKLGLADFDRVLVIGAGKATALMAAEIENLLGSRINAGVVNIPDYLVSKPKTNRIELHSAAHPVPNQSGARGVEKMFELVGKPSENDLVICLISGGGSALMPKPLDELKLSDEKKVTNLLLESGAPINEINTVRKHLSAVKGGRLAEKLYPARILSLIISDVVGDPLDAIASGPTVPDATTYEDAKRILSRYELWRKIPANVKRIIESGISDKSKETPKADSRIFKRVSNVLVGTNRHSCVAAAKYLVRAGYRTRILSTHAQGEAREVGKLYAGVLCDKMYNLSPSALVIGGETTVRMSSVHGLGGRNQELVLSCAIGIDGLQGAVIASMGTDGVDGPTNAAGAIADGDTIRRAKVSGLDASSSLENHDSYRFFHKLGDLLLTGPTGTNVNDIMILCMK